MNERIKVIGRQAGFAFIEDGVYGDRWYSSKCGMDASEFEKFAELIVKQCANIVRNSSLPDSYSEACLRNIADELEEHFGVEL